MSHHANASGVYIGARPEPREPGNGGSSVRSRGVAAARDCALQLPRPERACHLIAVRHPLSARQPRALAMQPQKDIAVTREHGPERLRFGWRQRIVCAVAAVIEQHGRKRPAARRTPHLCAQCQRSTPHVEQFGRGRGLAAGCRHQSESGDDDTNDAVEEDSVSVSWCGYIRARTSTRNAICP